MNNRCCRLTTDPPPPHLRCGKKGNYRRDTDTCTSCRYRYSYRYRYRYSFVLRRASRRSEFVKYVTNIFNLAAILPFLPQSSSFPLQKNTKYNLWASRISQHLVGALKWTFKWQRSGWVDLLNLGSNISILIGKIRKKFPRLRKPRKKVSLTQKF